MKMPNNNDVNNRQNGTRDFKPYGYIVLFRTFHIGSDPDPDPFPLVFVLYRNPSPSRDPSPDPPVWMSH